MAKIHYAGVNEFILSAHLAQELGIATGDKIRGEPNSHGLHLRLFENF